MRRHLGGLAIFTLVSLGAAGCSSAPETTRAPRSVPEATPTAAPDLLPRPDQPIPNRPARLAAVLTDTHKALRRDISAWLERGGGVNANGVRAVRLRALYEQRIYRKLVARPRLARRVTARLPAGVANAAKANLPAGSKLTSLVTPLEPPIRMKVERAAPPDRLLRFYRAASKRFGIPVEILAALNFVETKFGRILGPSSAGALGPMQFLPSTWAVYGRGDIMDPRDSIMAAARYLKASGAPARMRSALFAYNRSTAYVEAILAYARRIRHDLRNYYAYYFWQVFVLTTEGPVQLTGPGT